MNDLRKYPSESIKAMIANMRGELAAGIFTQEQLSETLSDYILRDEQGGYWALAPRSQQWYRHGSGGWKAVVSAPSSFEGPSRLMMWAPENDREEATAKTEIEGKTASNALEFMENMIADIQKSYLRGKITSVTAKALIADVFLMDQQNRFWTLGFHSKNWYFFEAEQWHKSDSPPDIETLKDTDSTDHQEQLDQLVISFLVAMAGEPPEPVAATWDPPDLFPEPIVQCPNCARVDVGNHTQCKFCQSDIPPGAKISEKPTKFCTQCGHKQPRQMKFCVQCGTKF